MQLNKILIASICIVFALNSFAQSVDFTKTNFTDKDGLKTANDALKKGNTSFNKGPEYFVEAIPFFLQAQEFNPNNAELNFKLGVCYINSSQRTEALVYVKKAYDLKPDLHPRIHYLLGLSYHLNTEWDDAIIHYRTYDKIMQGQFDASELFVDITKLIQECKNGRELMKTPVNVTINNLGPAVNTEYSEQGPVINATGSRLMFTSKRPGGKESKKSKASDELFEDIYLSKNVDGKWSTAVNIGEPVNSDNNDAAVGLSMDGSELFIFRGDRHSGNLFSSSRKGERWSDPVVLNENINSDDHEPTASISFDSKWLYFVSDRAGGFGGMDIYRSPWDESTQDWGLAENLGGVVNSEYDEEAIFAHPDGRTIYFSSTGHNSMGGYDVFSCIWDDIMWTRPKNMGYPLNTPDDDLYYVCSASGRTGYFSSVRSDGLGSDDIYHVQFNVDRVPMLNGQDQLLAGLGTTMDPMIEPRVDIDDKDMTLLHGWIKNLKELKGMEAYIEVMDLDDGDLVARFLSDPETGEYLVALPSGKDYAINIRADGYLFHSENISIPKGSGYMELSKEITMKEIEVGNHVVLKNIFFDPGQYAVKSRSKLELGKLAELMNENPTLKLEISGHTDNTGNELSNQELSEKRANAVVVFLNELGITNTQLVSKGYGPSSPIATNETENGRAQNRRTEFKVIAK